MRYRRAHATGNTSLFTVNLATKTNKVKPDLIGLSRRITNNLDNLDTTAYGYDTLDWVTNHHW